MIEGHAARKRFSPLLDGDGVASLTARPIPSRFRFQFQSPSRWGRCCFYSRRVEPSFQWPVSVPFSMGTVLLRGSKFGSNRAPRRRFSPLLDGDGVASSLAFGRLTAWRVSVPFSMGTVLLPLAAGDTAAQISPFQSPSRWGRCCFELIHWEA